jgi:hypothetical protein
MALIDLALPQTRTVKRRRGLVALLPLLAAIWVVANPLTPARTCPDVRVIVDGHSVITNEASVQVMRLMGRDVRDLQAAC